MIRSFLPSRTSRCTRSSTGPTRDSWRDFERDLEWFTGGAVDVQVVEWRELNEFPIFTDGFRYNPDEYVANRRAGSGWDDAGTDFYAIADSQELVPLVNSGQVDEIWMFGDHYFDLLGEAWMAGPNSFFINGPSFADVGFDRAIAGYGFNYERGVAEMVHNLGHRTENHGQRAFRVLEPGQPGYRLGQVLVQLSGYGHGAVWSGQCACPSQCGRTL